MKSKTIIKQNPEKEVPIEIMAEAVVAIAEGFKKLLSTRLTRDAIVVLIKERSGVSKNQINVVLNNLEDFSYWLKKERK